MYSATTIAQATGAPLANVAVTWPATVAGLDWAGINTDRVQIAAAATIAVETGIFFPIVEEGDDAYFLREFGSPYEAQYHGRGTIQCSWSYNYAHYGQLLGLDLLGNPELALRQDVAARVLASYFNDHSVQGMAAAGDWRGIRRAVNGGYNGWDVYIAVVNALVAAPPAHPPITTLGVPAPLQAEPKDASAVKADLAAGCVVTFNRPNGKPFGITPHWARVQVVSGTTQKLRTAVGLQGWLRRADLRTTS